MEQIDREGRFNVLDGAALVMGSAIASVHILRIIRSGFSGAAWIMVWMTFTWVAITATGPFIFLGRRYSRRLPSYPKIGDKLWALLGLPWLITALLQSALPSEDPRHNPLVVGTLGVAQN
jgi:hypothetical protein